MRRADDERVMRNSKRGRAELRGCAWERLTLFNTGVRKTPVVGTLGAGPWGKERGLMQVLGGQRSGQSTGRASASSRPVSG